MPVIDIDSHFYEPLDWYQQRFPELAKEIPPLDPLVILTTAAFGDLLGGLPQKAVPQDPVERIPPMLREMYRNATQEERDMMVRAVFDRLQSVPGAHKADERIAWCDAQGIDRQFVLPSLAFPPIARMRRAKPELTPKMLVAYNTWACEVLAGHTDRLIPVGVADFQTMEIDELKAELLRIRKLGARSFLFWPTPARGKSLAHPDFDSVWTLCGEIGMIPMVHSGSGRPGMDDNWLENGRPYPNSISTYITQIHQLPEIFLTELLMNGVFARNPNLHVFVCEFGVDWIPEWVRRVDLYRNFATRMGGERWSHPLLPSEYVRRQVRITPLEPDPTAEVIVQMASTAPEIVVFSSDYPHPEGGQEAVARYKRDLDGKIDAAALEQFMGASAAPALAAGA